MVTDRQAGSVCGCRCWWWQDGAERVCGRYFLITSISLVQQTAGSSPKSEYREGRRFGGLRRHENVFKWSSRRSKVWTWNRWCDCWTALKVHLRLVVMKLKRDQSSRLCVLLHLYTFTWVRQRVDEELDLNRVGFCKEGRDVQGYHYNDQPWNLN